MAVIKLNELPVKMDLDTYSAIFQPEERAHPLWKAHERIHTQVLHDVSEEIKVPREHLETQLIEKLHKKVDFDEAVQMEMDLYNKEIHFQS